MAERGKRGRGGAVAAGGAETVAAAISTLERGGNAVDAALAAALTAFHAEPLLASAAGGGVMLAGNEREGFEVLDFAPVVPGRGLSRRGELDFFGATIDFGETRQEFHVGRGAAAVPSTFAGLEAAHSSWGSLPLEEIAAPAVKACREGVVVTELIASILDLLEPIWSLSAESSALYRPEGRKARPGDRLKNPAFADSLERFAREGTAPFYTGDVAARAVEAFGPDAGGQLTAEDLSTYSPRCRPPLETTLPKGDLLLAPPPPTTGGSLISLALAMLSRCGLGEEDFQAEAHHRAVVDVLRLTLEVRAERLVEPRREVVEELLGEAAVEALLERLGERSRSAPTARQGRGETTHISVLDDRGGAAAITISNGEGCGHLIPGTGMAMNNFLGEEDINPGGFHRLPAGASMTTMMSPVVVLRRGRPVLVCGSGGSNRLRSAITQVVCNRLLLGQSLEAAVLSPRVHVEPDHLYAELGDASASALAALAAPFSAADLFPGRSLFFGGVHAVGREPTGQLVAVGDPRRGGHGEVR